MKYLLATILLSLAMATPALAGNRLVMRSSNHTIVNQTETISRVATFNIVGITRTTLSLVISITE